MLIDEVDRNLDPKRDGVGDLIAVINVGYKAGGTRPVLVPTKGGGWAMEKHSCFAPVAMAGISPNLPDDTRSRCIRVLLMRDWDDTVDETDWEMIEPEAEHIAAQLAAWAERDEHRVRTARPPLPPGIKGRARERWAPLKRVAAAASEEWSAVVDRLALAEAKELAEQREDGLVTERPAVALVRHIGQVWPDDADGIDTHQLVNLLINAYPDQWGAGSPYGRALTAQRLGQLLSGKWKITSGYVYIAGRRLRGYPRAAFVKAWAGIGATPQDEPGKPCNPHEPGSTSPLFENEPNF